MTPLTNVLCFHSDRFQEYKQKHQELKAAVAKELANRVHDELFTFPVVNGAEKTADGETGCGKEVENRGSPSLENTMESEQEQPAEEAGNSGDGLVSTAMEPEQEQTTDVDGDSADAGGGVENGETVTEVGTEPGEPEGGQGSTDDGEVTSDPTVNKMQSETDEVNGAINGGLESTGSTSALKRRGSLADVVLNDVTANGTEGGDTAVNGAAEE